MRPRNKHQRPSLLERLRGFLRDGSVQRREARPPRRQGPAPRSLVPFRENVTVERVRLVAQPTLQQLEALNRAWAQVAVGLELFVGFDPGHDPDAYRAADKRAARLLWSHLSPRQRASLAVTGSFEVVDSYGETWRILAFRSGNVLHERRGVSFCAGPLVGYLGDYLLAQKVWLENDSVDFLRRANQASPFGVRWFGSSRFAEPLLALLPQGALTP